ncbi:MAG: hypothetical protein HQL46_16060 [Gammaproteobacteria bacterium]|nr:hypothetical protein [Gammaproteobacteria bacterium]
MLKKLSLVFIFSLLLSCSSEYGNVKVLSISGNSVVYKVIMDSHSYSPGIKINDKGEIVFPKCPMREECNDVTFKSTGGRFNKYTAIVKDKKILKRLKKLME